MNEGRSGPHAVSTGAWLSAIDDQISVAVANLLFEDSLSGFGMLPAWRCLFA